MTNVDTDPTEPTEPVTEPEKQPKGKQRAAARVLTFPAVLAIVVVMAALVAIVFKVVDTYARGSDAIGVLGVIIPMFATVGAAVFGIPVAYERGAAKGEETAERRTDLKVKDATKDGEKRAREKLNPTVRALDDAVSRLTERVETGMQSPPGRDDFVVQLDRAIADRLPDDTLEEPIFMLPTQDIRDVRQQISELRASVDSLGS